MPALSRRFAALTLAAALSVGGLAEAQPGQVALAETLFRQGKQLMSDGRYAEACPKLAESQRLDPATGTLLALAVCHEAEGKTATAWAEFVDAAAAAERDGREDRVAFARERARALESNLSRLTIVVPPEVAQTSGLEVKRDGLVLGPAAWGTPTPVDPGSVTVSAAAPGKAPFTRSVSVASRRDRVTVTVPVLPDAQRAPRREETPASGPSPLQIGGVVVGAVGLASIAVGAYFGVQAIDKSDRAQALCSPQECTDPEAVAINDQAKVAANVSNVTLALGGVALVAGVVMLVIGADDQVARLELGPLEVRAVPPSGSRGASLSCSF